MFGIRPLCSMTTKLGTKVTKIIVPQNGLGNVTGKIVQFAPTSKMARAGITHTISWDAGTAGRNFVAYNGNNQIFRGVTIPDGFWESFPSAGQLVKNYLKKASV